VNVGRPQWLPDPEAGESTFVGSVLRQETVGGAIALLAAVVAVVWANVDYASYQDLRHLQLGPLDVEHWAADGALSLFFFVAGLELKRELLVGSLRRPADAVVPVVAAVCGVAVPALVYISVDLASGGDDLAGWAIPSATDIAFALAVLAVVGSALPTPLRAFLLTLAVVDDLLVIVIIGVRRAPAAAGLQHPRLRPPGGSHLVVRARERRPRHRGRHRARAAHAGDP
jgi:NhaA family Na+:H+ antiporter